MSSSAVAPADDDPGETLPHAEKAISNGDFYTGQWSAAGDCPHGHGKYLWTDGCMYVGEWQRGKAAGKGRFSWPSGATYEGSFKAGGYMDGKGTHMGAAGDTYRGYWVRNFKHGHGTKSYSNGDYYEGEWRRGLQDGHGRYQWGGSGVHYVGQWRNGMMHGSGTAVLRGGTRYDGGWEEGMPRGTGTFRWRDGGMRAGVWGGTEEEVGEEFERVEEAMAELAECRVSPCEKIPVFPSQKMMNWAGTEACVVRPPRRMSVDGSGGGGRGSNYGAEGGVVGTPHWQQQQPLKRQGVTIAKGHKNYELMLNLQLGIRY